MVTGGGSNNPISFQKFTHMKLTKAMNPFATNSRSHDNTVIEETAHMGPGYYSPKNYEIEITDIEKSRNNMYSTVSGTKASGEISVAQFMNATQMLNSGSGDMIKKDTAHSKVNMDRSIFGSSSGRFATQTMQNGKQANLPGPGNYYGFGAGNYNPGQKETANIPMNDSRTLDD